MNNLLHLTRSYITKPRLTQVLPRQSNSTMPMKRSSRDNLTFIELQPVADFMANY